MFKNVRIMFVVPVLVVLTFMGWGAKADFLSVPALVKLIGVEVASHTRLGGILRETSAMVGHVKEQTTLLKTAYRGIGELAHLSPGDIKGQMRRGLGQSFSGLDDLFDDLGDIQNLRYTNTQAERTLRNMLYRATYGPAVEQLHQQQENMQAVAQAQESLKRHGGLRAGEAEAVRVLAAACAQGEGACMAAAHRASLHQAAILSDVHEVLLHSADMQQRLLIDRDQARLSAVSQTMRFTDDFAAHAQAVLGLPMVPRRRPESGSDAASRGSSYDAEAQTPRHRPVQYSGGRAFETQE